MAKVKNKILEDEIENSVNKAGMEGGSVTVFVGRGLKEREPFIKLFQKQGEIINNCAPATAKVFLYFLQASQYGNYVEVDIKQISSIMNLSERTVKRSLDELWEKEVIVKNKDLNDKRRNVYYINPLTAWKGNVGDRTKSIKKLVNANQLKLL
jgi:predicted transcriptional regulator